MNDTITIRHSTGTDRGAIVRLGELDSRRVPTGEMLLAFVDGELRAALPLSGGDALADPFHPTVALVDLLRLRAAEQRPRSPRRRLPLGFRLAAGARA
jgi:hypothetical protein